MNPTYKGILVYLDDILIYTETLEEHMKLVKKLCHSVIHKPLYSTRKRLTIWATVFTTTGLKWIP